jgi:mutator protein MutT
VYFCGKINDMIQKKLASLLILEKEGQILLQRRFNTGFADGLYTCPSGKVEDSETFTQALIRETLEEVGIKILPKNIKSVHISHRIKSDKSAIWIDHFFLCQKWSGKINIKEPHKCDDLSWFDINNLPDNIIPFVKYALEQVFIHKTHYSEYGWEGAE